MGVVDTFGSCFFKTKNRVKTLSNVIFLKKENVLTIFSQEKYTWLWLQMAQFMTTWILWVFPTFMGHLQHILKIIILTKPGLGKFEKWLHVERNFYHSSSKIRKKKTKEWFPDFFFQRLRNNSNIFVDLDSPELFAKLGRFHLKEATCTY